MNKNKLNQIVDFCLVILLIINVVSVAFRSGREIHVISGVIFVIFILVHLFLHWSGIFRIIKNIFLNK